MSLTALGIGLASLRSGEHRAACPWCAATKPRRHDDALAVRVDAAGRATWLCHRCGAKGATGGRSAAPSEAAPRQPAPRRGDLRPALELFRSGVPVTAGHPAGRYLLARGCALPGPGADLRAVDALRHPAGGRFVAMLGLVTDATTGEPRTLHRTWLAGDGSDRKAPVEKPRLLWPGLPKAGGVVRLVDDAEVTAGLAVAEGIETALAAARAFGPATWACIDAGNLAALPVLAGIEALTVFADHDAAGLRAAGELADRWTAAGREVRVWRSPVAGQDAADRVGGAAA